MNRPAIEPRPLVDSLVFPEGPRWHAGRLWFSDMHAHRVFSCTGEGPEGGVLRIEQAFDDRPSGLGFLPDGRPVAVLMRSQRYVAFGGGKVTTLAQLAPLGGTHLNDMVVDAHGRAYMGIRDHAAAKTDVKSPERIALVTPDGKVRVVADDLWGPNGSAVSPDGKTLYVAETRANRISAFDILADGSLASRRTFAELPGAPDGMCIDSEGAAWFGNVFNGRFERVKEGGELLASIALAPGRWAVACVLGGADRRTLLMLTAYETVEHFFGLKSFDDDLASTARGFVETARVDVAGAGLP